MADVKNVNPGVGNARLTENQIVDNDIPGVARTAERLSTVSKPVGQPQEPGRSLDPSSLPPGQRILRDPLSGRDPGQIIAARQLADLGGVTALDRLLGLDLRPTVTGLLAPPPGNSEFLRSLSPQMRRSIMRKMLGKQREKMRRLARFVRKHSDGEDESEEAGQEMRESFIDVISEPSSFDDEQLSRAAVDLDRTARMLDVLEELLAMQDYTISQMGTFAQG
ncbi:MAG: hypothetical protein HOP17_01900 [Acidobacteria bacterium]|nr:hypothetical protein [Acidobacteriota bacterium]